MWHCAGDWWFVGVWRQCCGFGFLPWVAVFFFFGDVDGLGFFFLFFFGVLTVDYRLLVVVVVSGVCSAMVVVIVVLEQKEREKE